MRRFVSSAMGFFLLGGLCARTSAAAVDFPPITDAERALTRVASDPNAGAVVLYRRATLYLLDLARGDASSRLQVRERIKILSEAGKSEGDRELVHSSNVRLRELRARTVLSDGRVVALPSDARFERRLSKRANAFVTAFALPAVEVGAIVDVEYELRFDSFFFLEPWSFSDRLPVLSAEIEFHVPAELSVQVWSRDPFGVGIQTEKKSAIRGSVVRSRAENLPALPSEPYRFPDADLATRILLVPVVYHDEEVHRPLMENWANVSLLVGIRWDEALSDHGNAARKARELVRSLATARERAAAIYRFVRDEIQDDLGEGVFLPGKLPSVDRVLAARRGTSAEKAALLQAMLRAVDLPAKAAWAAGRSRGTVDPSVPNPAWFDRVLVAIELPTEGGVTQGRVFLEPSGPRRDFGHVDPDLEGNLVLLPDDQKPEGLVLPESPSAAHARHARLDLEVDERGLVSGQGRLRVADPRTAAVDEWQDWLVRRLADFRVSGVTVAEESDGAIAVAWNLALAESSALETEASLGVSRPLGPLFQPFTLPSAHRRSPILLASTALDEVSIQIRWPPSWKVTVIPRAVESKLRAGSYSVGVEVNAEERRAVVTRRFEVLTRQFTTPQECEEIRQLYEQAAQGDALALVLEKR